MRDAKRQTRTSEKGSKTGRRSKGVSEPAKKLGHKHVRTTDFRRTKSLEELAREQGIKLPMNIDELTGMGEDLWESDEGLDRFLAEIYRRRKEPDA